MTEFFRTQNARHVYSDLSHLKKKEQIETRLCSIAIKHGLSFDKASQAASDIMQVLLSQDQVLRDVITDADQALERFLDRLDQRHTREQVLGTLYTSLKLINDPKARMYLHTDPFCEEMTALWTQHHAYARENYDQVREQLRSTLRRFNLSAPEMKVLLDHLDFHDPHSQVDVSNNAEILREHMARSAITAMHLYLDNRKELTPQKAALITCITRDASAFHDGIIAGRRMQSDTEDALWTWAVLYMMLAATMLIVGVFCLEEYWFFLTNAAILGVIGGVPSLVRHPAGILLGLSKVKVEHEEPNQIHTYSEQTVFEDPTGLFDAHNYDAWDEMTDNALVY